MKYLLFMLLILGAFLYMISPALPKYNQCINDAQKDIVSTKRSQSFNRISTDDFCIKSTDRLIKLKECFSGVNTSNALAPLMLYYPEIKSTVDSLRDSHRNQCEEHRIPTFY